MLFNLQPLFLFFQVLDPDRLINNYVHSMNDTYFAVTSLKEWSYLGFYKYRYYQSDFSY